SRELHFKNPANPHTPPGIGGRGELEFIKHVRLPGFLTIYHGITTLPRIGDVSFFNPVTGRISAIGELKSKLAEPGTLIVRIHSIQRARIPFINLSRVPAKEEDREGVLGWEPQFKATLEQQMKKMADAIRCSEPNAKADLRNAYHRDELA